MTISQLAERSGVAASTLRYYDERGLLPAHRTPSGYRTYDSADLQRLGLICTAKRLGLPLDDIAELADVWREGACAQVKASLRPRVADRLSTARAHAADLAAFTDTLRGALAHLDALPDSAEACGPECGLLDFPARPADAAAPPVDPEESAEPEPADAAAPPIACSLDSRGMGDLIDRWRGVLADARREEIPGGLRAVLPAERAAEVADLAAAEQRCCPFFSFTMRFAHDFVALEVRAPAEASAMLDDVFRTPYTTDAADC